MCTLVRPLLACCFLIVVASDHLALAAESGQPKNILVLYRFSEHGRFDSCERFKSAIRSSIDSPVNFYLHCMEADWRHVRQSHIQGLVVPLGTIGLYRPTGWERSKKYVVAGIAVIILEAMLIAGLLWQRVRRKTATSALEKIGGLLIRAQEEERASIARELHDDFSQRLALQCIELTHLEKNLPESEVRERARAMKVLTETREMSEDMRSLSHQLHSSRLELVGLVCALRGLSAEITKNYKITVGFTEPELPLNLTKDAELCLFRVAQEALANVVKHSQASSALIELGSDANGISLRVSDPGKGFDPGTIDGGIGLMSMRERLRLFGGSLSVRSELMRGTEVRAQIPLSAANKTQAKRHIA